MLELRGLAHFLRYRRLALLLGGVFLAGVLVGWMTPWREIARRRVAARQAEDALAPLAAQAHEAGLDYAAVWSRPEESIRGAAVDWCLDHPGPGSTYVSGDPQKKVYWVSESGVPSNRLIKDRCMNTLAFVRGRRADGVILEFVAVRP